MKGGIREESGKGRGCWDVAQLASSRRAVLTDEKQRLLA